MGKLRILPFLHLMTLILALVGFNIPDFTVLKFQLRSDTYAEYHGSQAVSLQYQESAAEIELEKKYEPKIVFHLYGDEACLKERFVTPFSSPLLNQVSSLTLSPNLSPRAPPIA